MPKRNHRPVRTCLGCRQRDGKLAMVRLAAPRERQVAADFDARGEGRGGYLHPRAECIERFVNSKVKVWRSLGRRLDRHERIALVEAMSERIGNESIVRI